MTTEHVEIKRNVIEYLPYLSAEAVVVLLYLVDRSFIQKELGVGLSASELSRSCGIGYTRAKIVLDELESHEFITVEQKSTHWLLTVTDKVIDDGIAIPYTHKNTDDTKLSVLETEVRRLRLQSERARTKTSSGLADVTKGAERDVYLEIEKSRGFGLDIGEANLLGKCIAKFGPERTKLTYRQMRRQKNPILATYVALERGVRGEGKQVESEPFTRVRYRSLD
jgi:hypothetical protein